jgi:glucuronoarabinoxylan endo-1,4-beta-xylanase
LRWLKGRNYMTYLRFKFAIASGAIISLFIVNQVLSQNITVDLTAEKQVISGFGGMNCPTWGVNLTVDQTTTAFGNGSGQIGMTILRMMVNPNSGSWSSELTVAKKAVSLGAIAFASPWNAPSSMLTGNHVKAASYGAYADHLNSFVTYMKNNGVNLYAISVQNEPDYANDWTGWTAQEMLSFVKNNGGSIQTRLMAPESFQYRKDMSDPILNDPTALANLDILGAHFYGTQVRDMPYPLFKEKGAGKELWMTEVYVPNSNANSADNWPEALEVALNIHNAMVEGDFNAYVWWYIRRSYGMIKEDGQISKRGWCMAHFSKFARPGFKRVDATKSPTSNVYVSVYKNGDQVVIVAVNKNTSSKSLTFSITGTKVTAFTQYTTSSSKSLANDGAINVSSGAFTATIDAQSVATWVGNIAVELKNQDSEHQTNHPSISAKELSEYKIYDLRGRLVNSNTINALSINRSGLNRGLYIIKNNKTGGIRYLDILDK